MEMLVIAVVAVGAFAAVLLPLMRRGPRGEDPREYEVAQPAPDTRPMAPASEGDLETEVARYRDALRAGTVCGKCGQANPADSMFCFECGAAVPRAEAREFE